MTRDYELTFIVKPDVDVTNLAVLIDKVKGFITAESGIVLKVNEWGMRRLMYPIRKFRDGQYFFMQLQLDGTSIARLESRLRLTEDIIRYLLIRADEAVPVSEVPASQAPASQVTEGQAVVPETPPASETTTEPTTA